MNYQVVYNGSEWIVFNQDNVIVFRDKDATVVERWLDAQENKQ